MKLFFFLVPLLFLVSCSPLGREARIEEWNPTRPEMIEKYVYELLPASGKGDGRKESLEMDWMHTSELLQCISVTTRRDEVERVKIIMSPDGSFLSGTKEIISASGESKQRSTIRRNNDKLYVERHTPRGKKTKEYKVPKDKLLAVEASLLALFRSFPLQEDKEQDIFMVAFSQHSIPLTARQAGIENVSVPAGDFECYRMEVIVRLPIYQPKITYWITKEKPHFLVKHQGKQGPFTPSYITSLISLECHSNKSDKN